MSATFQIVSLHLLTVQSSQLIICRWGNGNTERSSTHPNVTCQGSSQCYAASDQSHSSGKSSGSIIHHKTGHCTETSTTESLQGKLLLVATHPRSCKGQIWTRHDVLHKADVQTQQAFTSSILSPHWVRQAQRSLSSITHHEQGMKHGVIGKDLEMWLGLPAGEKAVFANKLI